MRKRGRRWARRFWRHRSTRTQWINCDVRALDLSVMSKYGVIMSDPPWDIHMVLPYGTLTDEEMLSLNVGELAEENYLLLL